MTSKFETRQFLTPKNVAQKLRISHFFFFFMHRLAVLETFLNYTFVQTVFINKSFLKQYLNYSFSNKMLKNGRKSCCQIN